MIRFVGIVVAVVIVTGCTAGSRSPDRSDRPSLRLRIDAVDGGELDTQRYLGRVVVLHLFEAQLMTAHRDVEALLALSKGEPDRVVVIGVLLDPEGYPVAAAWRRALGVDYLVGMASEALRQGQSPLGRLELIPTTVILDRGGRIAHRIDRPMAEGELERLVEPLLGPDSGK